MIAITIGSVSLGLSSDQSSASWYRITHCKLLYARIGAGKKKRSRYSISRAPFHLVMNNSNYLCAYLSPRIGMASIQETLVVGFRHGVVNDAGRNQTMARLQRLITRARDERCLTTPNCHFCLWYNGQKNHKSHHQPDQRQRNPGLKGACAIIRPAQVKIPRFSTSVGIELKIRHASKG